MKDKAIIKKLKITGFKSLSNIVLKDISEFMVLAGANGSGKSNFVDALYFLSLVLRFGVNEAVKLMKGKSTFYPNKNIKNQPIHYYIEVLFGNKEYKYTIEINIKEESIVYENLIIDDDGEEFDYKKMLEQAKQDIIALNQTRKNKDPNSVINPLTVAALGVSMGLGLVGAAAGMLVGVLKNSLEKDNIKNQYSSVQQHSLLNQLLAQHNEFLQSLNNVFIYRINPIEAKKPSIDNADDLKSDGSNIASVLVNLESDDELRETILDWLSLIVPEMQTIKTDNRPIDGSKMIEFAEESGKKFPAHLVSDGTIYALCMLVAILTRTKKAGITIIEEPERGLHPKAIGELINFMREYASISHPIILTTHSESVVRELELNELFFVSKKNGKTKIKSVKDSGVDKNQIPLDTAWLTNMFDGGLPW